MTLYTGMLRLPITCAVCHHRCVTLPVWRPIATVSLYAPPSKNARTVRDSIVRKQGLKRGERITVNRISQAVKNYRLYVHSRVREWISPEHIAQIQALKWIKLRITVGYDPKAKGRKHDVANFHDELLDALAPALGVNNFKMLIEDMVPLTRKAGGTALEVEIGEAER